MASWTGPSILNLARGFMEPRILLTGAELDVFTILADAELTAAEVAARVPGQERPVTILLDALTVMGLLAKSGDRYHCEPEVAQHLSANSATSVLPMVLHAAVISQRWARLQDIARGTLQPGASDAAPDPAALRAFIGAMHVVGRDQAAAMAGLIGVGQATRLLDVGGASGTYTMGFLALSPTLRATLFDRPPVVEMARERLAEAGLLDRVDLVAGDFYVDDLPPGHDLALLSAIIHQNSRAQNVDLYRKCWHALVPGGRLVVRDHVLSEDRLEPRLGAIFAVNMLAGTVGGNCYTFTEIRDDLLAAGLGDVRQIHPDTRMDGIVEATRPA